VSETLRRVQSLVPAGDYIVSRHGFRELANDDVFAEDVMAAVPVEDYPDSRKEPSVLTLQSDGDGPVHVMWGIPKATAVRPLW
jgi:hypothetical protein